MKRSCGILLPVFSRPSPYGIGTFGKAAYQWIDFLKRAGQTYWQILPLGPTGYGDSPYQSFSAFAGNPYFIDLELLCKQGLLTSEECFSLFRDNQPDKVNYAAMYRDRLSILKKAFFRFHDMDSLDRFRKKNGIGWNTMLCLCLSKRNINNSVGINGPSHCAYESHSAFHKPEQN